MCDLKVTQINVLYLYELGYNITEAPKNICHKKDEVGRSTVTIWFKKFCIGCKNVYDEAMSGRPKSMDFETVLQVIEANLESIR